EPVVSLPLFFRGWTFRPEVGLRDTLYTETRIPGTGVGTAIQEIVDRRSVETAVEVRLPTLGRIFDRTVAGTKIKKTIEPHFIYRYTNGVDNFFFIIPFYYRDIFNDTNQMEDCLIHRPFL